MLKSAEMGILIISSLSFFSFRFVFEERDEIWGRVNRDPFVY